MGYFPHLVIGIPFSRVEALAQSLGVPWPYGTDPDAYQVAAERAATSGDDRFFAAPEPLAEAIAKFALPPEVTAGIYTNMPESRGEAHLFDDESWYPGLYGFDLYSSYTNKGIPEARAAGIGDGVQGYRMTPELIARGNAIRDAIAADIPLFAEATLAVFYVHW